MRRRLRGLGARLRDIAFRGAAEREAAEEMRFHIEMETEKHIAAGLEPGEARRRAAAAFGGEDRHREALRDGRRLPVLETLWEDVRFGARFLSRAPLLTALAALTIGLGVGATTAVVSAVDALLIRPLPLPDASRLVSLQESRSGAVSNGIEGMLIPYDRYIAYREATPEVFESLAAHRLEEGFSLRLRDVTVAVNGALTSGNYFRTLGVQPVLGRVYTDDLAAEIVISHELWVGRFGSDPDIVGRTVGLDGRSVVIVGVAPRGFGGATVVADQLWAPIGLRSRDHGSWAVRVVPLARLAPGVPRERADLLVDALARRIPPEEQATIRNARLDPVAAVPREARAAVGAFFGVFVGMALLVLLIAAANVAAIMLALGFARRRELAVRLAIGAGRTRVVRHLLAESLMIFAAGGVLGVGLAYAGTRALGSIDLPPQIPPLLLDLSPDGRTLAFAIALTGLTGLLFGLVPALQASRPELVASLKSGAAGSVGGGGRVRNVFVAGQVALAVALLLTGTLFARSLQKGIQTDIGFDPDGVAVVTINLGPPLDYDAARGRAFHRTLQQRIEALPGVQGVAVSQYVLLGGSRSGGGYRPADATDESAVHGSYSSVTPSYFETLGIPIVAGRAFTDADAEGAAPVVIINRHLADRLWPGQDPIGRLVQGPVGQGPAEVVGVTATGRYTFVTEEPGGYAFYPFAQVYRSSVSVHVRAPGAEAQTLRALGEEVRRLDPDIALSAPTTLRELVGIGLLPQRWATQFVGGLGIIGLMLAAMGIHGVVGHEVAQRTREFGIRRALGATHVTIIGSVLRRGGILALAGCLAGTALGAAVGMAAQSLLFGVRPLDPVTFLAVPAVLLGVAMLASWHPAARASRVAPATALRSE